MSFLHKVHGGFVFPRRISRLAPKFADLIPAGARVLDVGCGNGCLAFEISKLRTDLTFEGIDVLIRDENFIPVTKFDGVHIPYGDRSFDVVIFADVLHHTDDPRILLKEAKRVTRFAVVIKDHTRDGVLAGPRLRFMDWVGNARHGVALPYNYWPRTKWRSELGSLALIEDTWGDRLDLYPWWANWIFGSSLHFVARLSSTDS